MSSLEQQGTGARQQGTQAQKAARRCSDAAYFDELVTQVLSAPVVAASHAQKRGTSPSTVLQLQTDLLVSFISSSNILERSHNSAAKWVTKLNHAISRAGSEGTRFQVMQLLSVTILHSPESLVADKGTYWAKSIISAIKVPQCGHLALLLNSLSALLIRLSENGSMVESKEILALISHVSGLIGLSSDVLTATAALEFMRVCCEHTTAIKASNKPVLATFLRFLLSSSPEVAQAASDGLASLGLCAAPSKRAEHMSNHILSLIGTTHHSLNILFDFISEEHEYAVGELAPFDFPAMMHLPQPQGHAHSTRNSSDTELPKGSHSTKNRTAAGPQQQQAGLQEYQATYLQQFVSGVLAAIGACFRRSPGGFVGAPVMPVLVLLERIASIDAELITSATTLSQAATMTALLARIHESMWGLASAAIVAFKKLFLPYSSRILMMANTFLMACTAKGSVAACGGTRWAAVAQAAISAVQALFQFACPHVRNSAQFSQLVGLLLALLREKQKEKIDMGIQLAKHEISAQRGSSRKARRKQTRKHAAQTNTVVSRAGHALALCCLQALEMILLTTHADMAPKTRQVLDSFIITIASRGEFRAPFDDGQCRSYLYRLVEHSVIAPTPNSPLTVHLAMSLLAKGLQDSHADVAMTCLRGLSICEATIHPRHPSIRRPVAVQHGLPTNQGFDSQDDSDGSDEDEADEIDDATDSHGAPPRVNIADTSTTMSSNGKRTASDTQSVSPESDGHTRHQEGDQAVEARDVIASKRPNLASVPSLQKGTAVATATTATAENRPLLASTDDTSDEATLQQVQQPTHLFDSRIKRSAADPKKGDVPVGSPLDSSTIAENTADDAKSVTSATTVKDSHVDDDDNDDDDDENINDENDDDGEADMDVEDMMALFVDAPPDEDDSE